MGTREELPRGGLGCHAERVKLHPLLPCLALGLSLGACQASVSAKASASTGKDKDVADYDRPLSAKQLTQQKDESIKYALLGARHDLNYAAQPKEDCRCLAVAAGQPSDARFSWEAAVPTVDQTSQVVIALTSQSIACAKAKKDSLGASYQGYEVEGDDVIVIVEEAKAGRPLTAGGIVPRPTGQGGLFVRPSSNDLPYGKSLSPGESRCRVDVGATWRAEA
jgi:hypothetical protein